MENQTPISEPAIPQPPISPQISLDPTPQPKKSLILPITITLSIITLLGAVGYFYLQNRSLKSQLKSSSLPLPSTQVSADPTSTWQTYSNPQLGFSIKYPPSLKVVKEFNDTNNRAVIFEDSENRLEVMLRSGYGIDLNTYYYMDTTIDHTATLANIPANVYVLPGGVCDGNVCTKPITTIVAPNGPDLYHVSFYGNTNTTELYNQILSTFQFTDPTTLPQGWSYQPAQVCPVSFPTPPGVLDLDNRKWTVEKGDDQPFGLWSGKRYSLIHRNPEEASGFVSGIVTVSCWPTKSSTNALLSELNQYLIKSKSDNNDSEFIIQIKSSQDINKWNTLVKEIIFSGGMYDAQQKYYLFEKNNQGFLVTSKSDSNSPIINQQTTQILDLLKYK